MKLNLKVRMKNPYFWVGIGAVILSALSIDPTTLTSWTAVWEVLVDFATNPFKLVTVVLAVMGVFLDPTTSGIGDSDLALSYTSPSVPEEIEEE